MSKKKTLSLKDFHGGSIPSDLPLPSAPGAVIRSAPGLTASPNLGTNFARSDLRPRPKSSGGTQGFDEKASFLSHQSPIGQNFDEDERKPLDGLSVPRRTISDETIRRSASILQESKPSYGRDMPVTSPVSNSSSLGSGRFSGGFGWGGLGSGEGQFGWDLKGSSESNSVNVGVNNIGGRNSENNNPPNAWRVRRDVGGSPSMGVSNASKFAQASAIDKVSSGMWQLKSPSQVLPELVKGSGGGERGDFGGLSGIQSENDGIIDDVNQGREWISRQQFQSQICKEEGWDGANSVGSPLYATNFLEESERPTVKFLPRSKTVEKSENDYRQAPESGQIRAPNEFRVSADPSNSGQTAVRTGGQPIEKVERPKLIRGSADLSNSGQTAVRTGGQPIEKVERPKLNLKPRSQPLDQTEGSLEKERNSLFGGARPRELVLKERGVDDVAINNLDTVSPGRATSSKKEGTSESLVLPARNNPKFENRNSNRRFGRDPERKDQQMDNDKGEAERRNWRNDKWRSNKDAKEQRPEPEIWRKPIEEPKPATTDASGFRHGKLVSALELAQAFSRSVSDPKAKATDVHSSQRGLGGRNNQVPFSRLAAPTPIHRING